jgi:Domain of unknown function (DUF397)
MSAMTRPDLSGAIWRKSTRSGGTGGNCVEVALNISEIIAIRDSKDPHGPSLAISPATWEEFKSRIRAGHFDLA